MRKAKRILSLVICLAMVIMTVPALSLTALAVSEGVIVNDGSANFHGSGMLVGAQYSSSNILGYKTNVPSVFGKSADDVSYEIPYHPETSETSDEQKQAYAQVSSAANPVYISADIAFTSADESLYFSVYPYLNAEDTTKDKYMAFTISASGVVGANHTDISGNVPAFKLNQWYNIAFVNGADGTADCTYLYVNGVGYKLTHTDIPASYGTYRLRMEWKGTAGKIYMDNLIGETNATGENAYDPTAYQMNVDVSSVTGASIEGNALYYTSDVTLAQITEALEGYTVKGYTNNTYATELASDAVLGYGDVIVVSNGNGAFRYYTVKEKLVLSEGVTVNDGVTAFASYTHTNSKPDSNHVITITSGVSSVFGKSADDVAYRIDADTTNATKMATLKSANTAKSPAYISFDVAFTGPNSSIRFYRQGYKEEAMTNSGTSTYFDLTPAGVSGKSHISKMDTVPAFNYNEWYNIAYVLPETSGTTGILYVNGVAYNITYDATLYGAYRFRADVYDGYEDTFYLDNLIADKTATGYCPYNPAIHTLADITSTHADVSVANGDLKVNNFELTAGELMASLNKGRNNAVLYTDRTYATEVASDAVLSELDTGAVLLYSNHMGSYRYYDINVTDEADETGINTGNKMHDNIPSALKTAKYNVAGTGVKTADDVVLSIGPGDSSTGLRFQNDPDVIEMSIKAPDNGFVSFVSSSYIGETKSDKKNWYLFKLTNDGFYRCSWDGNLSDKIADAEAGRWYNIALIMPEDGGRVAELYIDGVKYAPSGWPFASDGNFYGVYRAIAFCDTNAGTAYFDNIRYYQGSYSTKYELPAEVSAVADSGVTVYDSNKTIVFNDEFTVEELISKLSINERAHAIVRVYSDGTFARQLGDDEVVNDGAVVVVAAKNGYTFERVYSYYEVEIRDINETIFDFEVIDEEAKTAKITGFFSENITEETDVANIVIPSEILGYTIVEIGAKAFYCGSSYNEKNKEIRTVVIPDGVTTIGNEAFRWDAGGNGKITAITLPDSIETIGDKAFYNLASVTELNLTNNLDHIGSQAFYSMAGITEVIIPASVTYIGAQAFQKTGVKYVEFEKGSGLSALSSGMFDGCSSLKTVIIPDDITVPANAINASGCTIYGLDGSATEESAAAAGIAFVRIIDDVVVIDGAVKGNGVKALSGTSYDIDYGYESLDYVGTVKNFGDSDKVLKAIVVLFDGNDKMLARVEDEVIVFAGEEVDLADKAASLEVDGLADGYKVKAFLWDATSYAPVSDGEEVVFDADIKELHLLTIGNSFTNDSKSHLGDVFKANDVILKTTTLYIGSSTLKDHYDNMVADKAAYDGRKIGDSLLSDKWDVVTVQAATHGAVDYNDRSVLMKYGTDEATAVFEGVRDYIAERAPQAKRVMHMTWVPCDEEAVKMYGAQFESRAAALEGIKAGYEAASEVISTGANMMIPTYYAIEALVAQGVPFHSGDLLTNAEGKEPAYRQPTEMSLFRDETCHLTYDSYGAPYGRVLASLTWFEYLTGIDVTQYNNYTHPEISDEEMDMLEAAAHAAQQYVVPLNLWGQN